MGGKRKEILCRKYKKEWEMKKIKEFLINVLIISATIIFVLIMLTLMCAKEWAFVKYLVT